MTAEGSMKPNCHMPPARLKHHSETFVAALFRTSQSTFHALLPVVVTSNPAIEYWLETSDFTGPKDAFVSNMYYSTRKAVLELSHYSLWSSVVG